MNLIQNSDYPATLAKAEENHTGDHQDTTHDLDGSHLLAQKEVSPDCGKSRLEGCDQICHSSRQVAETYQIKPESADGWPYAQKK